VAMSWDSVIRRAKSSFSSTTTQKSNPIALITSSPPLTAIQAWLLSAARQRPPRPATDSRKGQAIDGFAFPIPYEFAFGGDYQPDGVIPLQQDFIRYLFRPSIEDLRALLPEAELSRWIIRPDSAFKSSAVSSGKLAQEL
jgi:hypothetical protein